MKKTNAARLLDSMGILYEIRDNVLTVIVIWVGARGSAYKKL